MIEDAKRFISDWIDEHVNAEGFAGPDDRNRARELAKWCTEAAKEKGFSARDLHAAARDMIGGGDDLVNLIAHARDEDNDEEIAHLADKDD
jgi:hypothetical protein